MKKILLIFCFFSFYGLQTAAADIARPETPLEATIYAEDDSPLVYVKQERNCLFVRYTPKDLFNVNNTFQAKNKDSLELQPNKICTVKITQTEKGRLVIEAPLIDKQKFTFLQHSLDFERSQTRHIIPNKPNTIEARIPFK